jgi:Asp-tRNA(Asn)/Glu-tRNA(Gln) amidotransferase A subunit family amidase
VGSTIRPAAFYGVVGFKPSFNRVSTAGVIPFSASLDTLGLFTQEIAGLDQAAAALCPGWRPAGPLPRPVLAVPEGPYLDQASAEGRAALEAQAARLGRAGYVVKRLKAFLDLADLTRRHWDVAAAELAQVHAVWFARHRARYRPRTEALILKGQAIGPAEAHRGRESFVDLRWRLEALMDKEGIDLWVCPSAPGPAPAGLAATGDPALNLPWTQAGLPALSLPAGRSASGLPLGLQVVARFWADERLLAWAAGLERTLKGEG